MSTVGQALAISGLAFYIVFARSYLLNDWFGIRFPSKATLRAERFEYQCLAIIFSYSEDCLIACTRQAGCFYALDTSCLERLWLPRYMRYLSA